MTRDAQPQPERATAGLNIDQRLAAAGLPPLPRRVWLEIDLAAMADNVGVFREMVGPGVMLSAVVKADAYGHGLVPVARALEQAGVDRLCVASLDEAVVLREAGIETDILVLFPIPAATVDEAGRYNVQLTVLDPASLMTRLENDDDLASVEVEVETGLTRGGLKPEDVPIALKAIRARGRRPGPLALWTHMASPDNEAATTMQIQEFERAVELARAAGEHVGPTRHIAATGALLTGRVPAYEGVRIGLGLYGLLPLDLPIAADARPFADRLRPAMELKAMPLRVETFPAGTGVGYGGTWVAPRESVIATLPVGYGDGWARAYSPGAQALVRGSRVPLVGTVAMDAVMADVTEIPGVGLDDEFVLLGRQGRDFIDTHELARLRNTIPWEVVTSMSFRVPRVYHAASVLMGIRTLSGEKAARTEAVE